MTKIVIVLVGLAVATLLVVVGCKATRSGYESAAYQVVRSAGKFEVRDYPALRVVETDLDATTRDGMDGSFNRLFRFITGENEARQKIAMTTPVFMSGDDTNATLAFVLPARLTPEEMPQPADPSVRLRETPPGRFAVLRFRGGRNLKNESEALRRLEAWMATEQLPVQSPPVFGYFDPPWTPTFLRRNEVMLRTSAPSL